MSDPDRIPTEVDTKIDDLGNNTEPIVLLGSINQNTDDALHLTSKEEKDDKKSTNDNSKLENLSSNIGEGKDDEKVSPVSTEEKELSIIFTDENEDSLEDPRKEHGIEISSPPHVEMTENQNDALLKEADDEQTVVVSSLHESQEEKKLTHEKTTTKLDEQPIWMVEKEKCLNASLEERKRRKHKCTEYHEIETWPEYYNKHLNNGIEKALAEFPEISNKVSIWEGDITSLLIDAIVNAANERLLGGGGVDGAIHSAAGPLLKEECYQFGGRSAGESVITAAYQLPAKYVIHTVGPRGEYPDKLKDCYRSSLQLLIDEGQRTIAFPCISTGIFGYPNDKAADVVLKTVQEWLETNHEKVDRVIFCLFLPKDVHFYEDKLLEHFPMQNVLNESPEKYATENRDENKDEQEDNNESPEEDATENRDANKDESRDEREQKLINESPEEDATENRDEREQEDINGSPSSNFSENTFTDENSFFNLIYNTVYSYTYPVVYNLISHSLIPYGVSVVTFIPRIIMDIIRFLLNWYRNI